MDQKEDKDSLAVIIGVLFMVVSFFVFLVGAPAFLISVAISLFLGSHFPHTGIFPALTVVAILITVGELVLMVVVAPSEGPSRDKQQVSKLPLAKDKKTTAPSHPILKPTESTRDSRTVTAGLKDDIDLLDELARKEEEQS